MNSDQHSISIIIPVYNSAGYISRAIDSVLAQTHLPDEIIIVDDGSTDNTVQVIQQYEPKIKLIQQANTGASAARNTGIEAATGEWIAFLDADDEWLPEKLQLQTDLLKRNPHLVWTAANFYRCLCDENRKAPDLPPEKLQRILQGSEFFSDYLKAYRFYARGHTDTMLIKRTVLEQTGLFTTELMRFEDMDMWFRIAYQNPQIGYLPQPLAVHHMNITHSVTQKEAPYDLYCPLIRKHLNLAAKYDRLEAFEPCAVFLIRQWTRSMLFDARKEDIRKIISEFSNLLPTGYKLLMKLLTTFPKTTAATCRIISKVVRSLNLRKGIFRKPTRTG